MKIRDAQKSDLAFLIHGLERNRALEGRAPGTLEATASDVRAFEEAIGKGTVRVVEDGGEPVAFLSFRLDFQVMYVTGPFLWIDLVYVQDGHRGRGLGRRLYEEAADLARQHGCNRVVADVFAANAASIEFHRSVGFEPLYTIFQKEL